MTPPTSWGRYGAQWAISPGLTRPQRYAVAVLWCAVIFIVSSVPGNRYPQIDLPNIDKGMHFILFLPLGWLLARSITAPDWRLPPAGPWFAVIAGCFYGATDELHQHWVPNRTPSIADWLVDCLAVMAGVLAWKFYAAAARRRLPVQDTYATRSTVSRIKQENA